MMYIKATPDSWAQREAVLSAERIRNYQIHRSHLTRATCHITELDNTGQCPQPLVDPILVIGNSHEVDGVNILVSALPSNAKNTVVMFGSIHMKCDDRHVVDGWPYSENEECNARFIALREALKTVDWHAVVYSARSPYAENKAVVVPMLEALKAKQPDLPIIVFGSYISNREDCAIITNASGTPLACLEPENVVFFDGKPPSAKDASQSLQYFADDIKSLTTAYFDKVGLLCPDRALEKCPATTPDGHPMFVDRHHLTYEFAAWMGERLAESNPQWLQDLATTGD